jgi:hypothetical protein
VINEPRVALPASPTGGELAGGAPVPTKPRRTRSQIAKANIRKGKDRENRVAAFLRVNGFPGAERTVRTGYRTTRREFPDQGDIDGTPGIGWQIKAVAEREWYRVSQYMLDTEKQAKAAGNDFGVLVIPRPRHGNVGEWWAHMYFSDLLRLVVGVPQAVGETILRFPVRFELGELPPLLRVAGYGTPLDDEGAA